MITECRSCGSGQIEQVLTLGSQHLSDFREDDSQPPEYPLDLLFCHHCLLVQLGQTVPREHLYGEHYGFYSGVNEGIKKDLGRTVHLALGYKPEARAWLDIACNDGTLLCQVPERIYRVGVDPVTKFKHLAERCADEIIPDYFTAAAVQPGHFNVVTASSVFYDLDDPGDFVEQVKQVMAPHAVWVIQQNYLGAMITNLSIDNICHEHITYWSLAALVRLMRQHGMQVVHVQRSDVNGGSFRTVVTDERSRCPEDVSVQKLLADEGRLGLSHADTYRRFRAEALGELRRLRVLLEAIKSSGERCYIYAASTRGATLWQAAGITAADCRYAVERNPAKVGLYFSPIGVPIISEEQARDSHPDYMLVGPWWFRDQIIERERRYLAAGGKLIFPLPKLEVIGKAGHPVPIWVDGP